MWVQDGFDCNLEFFQFYTDCGLEHFFISLAIRWGTLKGFLSQIINLGFVLGQVLDDIDWQTQVVVAINSANFTGQRKYWQKIGWEVGTIIARIVDFRVPSYEYVYGESMLRELQTER